MNYTDTFHSPDLQFLQFCHEQFGINRGVYNTIDQWFFQEGIKNILYRRKIIHHFLSEYQQKYTQESNGKVMFGHGNLSKILKEYTLSIGSHG